MPGPPRATDKAWGVFEVPASLERVLKNRIQTIFLLEKKRLKKNKNRKQKNKKEKKVSIK